MQLCGSMRALASHCSEHKVRVESTLDGQLGCAARFRHAMESIRDEGWYPDIVISHSGWGCGLEVSWVFLALSV